MHAISLAGGPKEIASLDEAYLKKAGSKKLIRLNLYELLVKGDMTKNLSLSPGDIIYVPQGTKNQIYVLGEVNNPGVYRMKEGITLLEAIGQAGSETSKAKLERTSVIRKKKDGSQPDIYIVNVMQILREGKMKYNLKLQPGDIVYVPKSVKPQWDRILPMLNTISITHDLVKGW
jgi:polysaccharide export outer membrane protein